MEQRTCVICDAPLNDRQKVACSKPCRMKHYWTTPEGAVAKARATHRVVHDVMDDRAATRGW